MASSTRSSKKTPERELAEIAVRKVQLDVELRKVRDELKAKARDVELPVAVELEHHAVLIKSPQYNGMPSVTIAPLFR